MTSPSDSDEVLSAVRLGWYLAEVRGRNFKINRTTVHAHVDTLSLASRYPRLTPGDVKEAAEMYRAGKVTEIERQPWHSRGYAALAQA